MRNDTTMTAEVVGGRWARFWDALRRSLAAFCC